LDTPCHTVLLPSPDLHLIELVLALDQLAVKHLDLLRLPRLQDFDLVPRRRQIVILVGHPLVAGHLEREGDN
jgi:hypothetical protein